MIARGLLLALLLLSSGCVIRRAADHLATLQFMHAPEAAPVCVLRAHGDDVVVFVLGPDDPELDRLARMLRSRGIDRVRAIVFLAPPAAAPALPDDLTIERVIAPPSVDEVIMGVIEIRDLDHDIDIPGVSLRLLATPGELRVDGRHAESRFLLQPVRSDHESMLSTIGRTRFDAVPIRFAALVRDENVEHVRGMQNYSSTRFLRVDGQGPDVLREGERRVYVSGKGHDGWVPAGTFALESNR